MGGCGGGGGSGGGSGGGGGTSWVQIVMSVMTWICAIISLRKEDAMLIHCESTSYKRIYIYIHEGLSSSCEHYALYLKRVGYMLRSGVVSHCTFPPWTELSKKNYTVITMKSYDYTNNCTIFKQNCNVIAILVVILKISSVTSRA